MAPRNGITPSSEYGHRLRQFVRVNGSEDVLCSVGESAAHLYFFNSGDKCFAVFPRDNRPAVEAVFEPVATAAE